MSESPAKDGAFAAEATGQDAEKVRLRGFPSRSTAGETVRLYLDDDRSTFIDFPESDLLTKVDLDQHNPNAPIEIWVRAGTSLIVREQESQQIQAQFLQGALVDEVMPQSDKRSMMAMGMKALTGWNCLFLSLAICKPVSQNICPSYARGTCTPPGPDDATYWC